MEELSGFRVAVLATTMRFPHRSLVPCCAVALTVACLLLAPTSVRAQTGGGRGLTFTGAGGPGAVTLSSSMGQINTPFSPFSSGFGGGCHRNLAAPDPGRLAPPPGPN